MTDGVTVHVAPSRYDNRWALRKQGSFRAAAVYRRQDEAVKTATNLIRRVGGALIVHGVDGRIQSTRNYRTATRQ